MERASRLILIASIALAGLAHAWLVSWHAKLAPAALAAFVMMFALARISPAAALVLVGATGYAAPALLAFAFGTSDHHLLLVWLAALGGAIVARSDWRRWHLPNAWTFPLVAWGLVVAVSWPVVAGREVDFSLVAVRALDSTNSLFEAPPRAAAAFVILAALGQMLGILWLDFLWAISRASDVTFRRVIALPFLFGAVCSAIAGIYQQVVDITWLNPPIWIELDRASGLMFDGNAMAIGAAIWAPVAIVLMWTEGRMRWAGWLAYAILTGGMLAGGSRTALLAWAIGTIGVVVGTRQRLRASQARMTRALIAVFIAAACVLALAFVPRELDTGNALRRAINHLPRLEAAEMRRFAADLWVRNGYGAAAHTMIAEHPVSGVGVGAFHVLAPDYIYRDSGQRLPADNAQNWWRHQLAELGVVGALPSLWFSIVVLFLLKGKHDVKPRGAVPVLRCVIAGFGVASLLGVPAQHPATWLSFAAVLVWLGTALENREPGTAGKVHGWRLGAIWIAVIVAAGLATSARGDLRVANRALRSGVPYTYGLSRPDSASPMGDVRWLAKRAVIVRAVRDRVVQLTIWNPDFVGPPVAVRVQLNGREVLHQTIGPQERVSSLADMPEGAEWVMFELEADREMVRDRAVQMAMRWYRARPTGADAAGTMH